MIEWCYCTYPYGINLNTTSEYSECSEFVLRPFAKTVLHDRCLCRRRKHVKRGLIESADRIFNLAMVHRVRSCRKALRLHLFVASMAAAGPLY